MQDHTVGAGQNKIFGHLGTQPAHALQEDSHFDQFPHGFRTISPDLSTIKVLINFLLHGKKIYKIIIDSNYINLSMLTLHLIIFKRNI